MVIATGLPGVYVVCSAVFNDVASVAKLANGFVGFADGGGGIAIGAPELVPWPGCGCEVTGWPVSMSVKSSCSREKIVCGGNRIFWLVQW